MMALVFHAQMANKIVIKRLPSAFITLLGSGIMHWSKDKQIDVIQGMAVLRLGLQRLAACTHLLAHCNHF